MALDFFAGCLGGCSGVIVGHPLDTIKVHMQTQNCAKKSTAQCIKQLVAREGYRGLFKGMTSPLAGVAGLNAIVFGIYGHTQRSFNEPDSLQAHILAGSCAGFFQSYLASPIELAKLRAQISNSNISPLTCTKQIYNQHGVKGIFQGVNMTILRDVPSFACYFLTYEYLLRLFNGRKSSEANTTSMLMAGGISGVISWTVTYPIDVLKTRLQCDGANGVFKYSNAWDCFKQSWISEGHSFMFRGLTPTIIRAFPVNAAVFTVFTWTMRLLDQTEFQFDIYVIPNAESV